MRDPARRGGETVHVTARVPRDLAVAFEQVARDEDRTVSAELRRLMRRHVAERDCEGARTRRGAPLAD
jgi:hypothetical protein